FEREKCGHFSIAREVAIKLIRCDTRHDMRDVVHRDRLADDVRIGSEIVLPVPVSENHLRLGIYLRLRAAALALIDLRLRAAALALIDLRLRAAALALIDLRLRAAALALRGAEARSAKQRHAHRLKIVRRNEHCLYGILFDLALSVRPAHK